MLEMERAAGDALLADPVAPADSRAAPSQAAGSTLSRWAKARLM